MKVEVDVLGSCPNKPTVSVDVKQHFRLPRIIVHLNAAACAFLSLVDSQLPHCRDVCALKGPVSVTDFLGEADSPGPGNMVRVARPQSPHGVGYRPVSYTHLTLPTNHRV